MVGANSMRWFRKRRDESGEEFVEFLFAVPIVAVLIIASIVIGYSIRTRMMVYDVTNQAVTQVAAQGGNNNPRTSLTGQPIDAQALTSMWNGSSCTLSACSAKPSITCNPPVAPQAGALVTCTTVYPMVAPDAGLFADFHIPIGALLGTFTVTETQAAQTGNNGL